MKEAKQKLIIVAKRPVSVAGDSLDADLPDGTRVVSTSTTANGQTTVTSQLLDKDGNVLLPTDTGVQVASNTFELYLNSQGKDLNEAQQQALAEQLNSLNLGGGEAALSFYPLPTGSTVIANADGEIVGEIKRSSTGELNLNASALDENGHAVQVSQSISEKGEVSSHNSQAQEQATALFNSVIATVNWSHMSDLGKLSAVVNLYNATDKLGEVLGGTGDNLAGDVGSTAGYLQLAQGIQSGDNLVIANGINVISDGALDGAINSAAGTAGVPYLSAALAVNDEFFRRMA